MIYDNINFVKVAVSCIWIASKLEEYFPADLGYQLLIFHVKALKRFTFVLNQVTQYLSC